MKHYEILIVGAGLYGSVMARRLTDAGYKVLVIDKRDRIGGNCASADMNGIDVHLYGPHVFHTSDKQVWNYINRFGEFRQFTHKIMVDSVERVFNFPINKKTIFDVWGMNKIPDIVENDNPQNFEEYAISKVGIILYAKFIKGYTEKQWNCDPKLLPVSIIKRIPVRDNYDDSYFNDYYQGIPFKGYNALFENLLEGIEIRLNTHFLLNDMPYLKSLADKIIYTGPINEYFFNYHGKLDWRSLRFEFKELSVKDFQGISVIHYPEKKYDYTRITEFKHFNPFNEAFEKDYTVYAEEYPCNNPEEPYYPVENNKNIDTYMKYFEMAQEEKNVHFAGRLGTYKYNDMDVTVKNALDDSMKIIRGELLK